MRAPSYKNVFREKRRLKFKEMRLTKTKLHAPKIVERLTVTLIGFEYTFNEYLRTIQKTQTYNE